MDASELGTRIVGREAELAALETVAGDRSLVLVGAPGVGKSTLWEAGVGLLRERGHRVLLARGSGAETQLSSTALIDLLDGVSPAELDPLPEPQRQALDVALLRALPDAVPPEPHAVAMGLLTAFRELAERDPVVVAIDDLQWVDRSSLEALAFAARRLTSERLCFLLARRPGSASELERALGRRPLQRVELAPLSFGATRRLLAGQLGLVLARNVLRRVFEVTLGNPLFTLEVGRALREREAARPDDDLPIPDHLEDLLGTRVEHLDPLVRRTLLALALQADLRVAQLAALSGASSLEDAVEAGIVVVDGERVRPSHPLLAAAAKKGASARERRQLHLELAEVVADEELRDLHLALATRGADQGLAAKLAVAAAAASARGAAQESVVHGEHALRLTPPASAKRNARLLALARYLEVAGARRRVTDLLTPEVDSLPEHDRVHAWLRLGEGGAIKGIPDSERYLDLALADSEGDAALHALVLAKKSHLTAATVSHVPEAEGWALEALSLPDPDPQLERLALHGLGWARALRGRPIDEVCARFAAVSDAATHITESPEPVEGLRLLWRGRLDEARPILVEFKDRADARGEEVSYALQRMNLCELELRSGNWQEAERLLDEWESADRQLLIRATYLRTRAHLAVGRGGAAEAARLADAAYAGAEPGSYRWQMLESLRVRGTAALLAGEPARAAESLRSVWAHMEQHGVDDPGVFPVAPDLVEALVALRKLDEARAVTERLRALSEEQDHPWGRASTDRCAALIQLARGTYDEEAAVQLTDAADAYGALGLRFDRARSLLALGRAQRRLRKWALARAALDAAASAFDELGSPGWVEQASEERGRVGGRRPRTELGLSAAEQRVAELAAEGLANKEIAQRLFVSVRTVEVHLKNAYKKLGIRSRTQLARRLSAPAQTQ